MIGPIVVEYDAREDKIVVLTQMPTKQRYRLAEFTPYHHGKENIYSEMQGIGKMISFTFKCEAEIKELSDNVDYGEYVTDWRDDYDGID